MPKQPAYSCPECGGVMRVPHGHSKVRCPYCRSDLLFRDGLRGRGALLSVRCPTCGANTRCPEDSLTARCSYCGGWHLIVGEGRPFRMHVLPTVSAEQAAAEIRRYIPGGPAPSRPEMVFVPYWRMRCLHFSWHSGARLEDAPSKKADPRAFSFGIHTFGRNLSAPLEMPKSYDRSWGRPLQSGMKARRVDRSILAGSFGLGMRSLGVRLQRFDLHPYDRDVLGRHGRVLMPTMGLEDARKHLFNGLCHALKDHVFGYELRHGNVVRPRFSLTWVPYWLFWKGTKRVTVSGMGAGIVPYALPVEHSPVSHVSTDAPSLVPAQCPGCGTTLTLSGFESVFFCRTCRASWREEHRRMVHQEYRVVRGSRGKAAAHLPVWRLRVGLEGKDASEAGEAAFRSIVPRWGLAGGGDSRKPFHIYVAGWGNRLRPRLSMLSKRWTYRQPELELQEAAPSKIHRAIFGRSESHELALLTLLNAGQLAAHAFARLKGAHLQVKRTDLLLIPSRPSSSYEWTDTVTETAIPGIELDERSPG